MSNTFNSLPITITIIWAALTMSQLIYAVVGTIVEIDESLVLSDPMIGLVLFVGLMAAGIAAFAVPMFVPIHSESSLFTVFIIQWAVTEVISVAALVSRFLGGPDVLFYGLIFLSMVTMICLYPTKKRAQDLLKGLALE